MPARNEEEVIERSVAAALEQAQLETLVVVDDQSTDRTKAQLLAMKSQQGDRLIVLQGQGPSPGECGKPKALTFATSAHPSEAPWLLFLDADVVLQPGALAALLRLAQDVDVVSMFPKIEMKRAMEHIVMPSVGAMVIARYPPQKVGRSSEPVAFANGQLILVRRSLYEKIGGHRRVLDQILEDVRLAEHLKAARGRFLIIDGRALASTRMYASWSELVEGWTKNLYLLMGGRPRDVWVWGSLSLVLGLSGPVALLAAAAAGAWELGLTVYGVIMLMQVSLRVMAGASAPWAVFAPLGAVLSAWLLLRSARAHAGGKPIGWKGRTYSGPP